MAAPSPHLAALVVLAGGALAFVASDPALAAPKRAFVTSATGTGNLSSWPAAQGLTGLAAGDQVCRTLAANASLPNPQQYVAWLSDTDDDAYCRLHGLTGQKAALCGQGSLPANAGPWARTDGRRFAGPIAELVAGVVYNAATQDELGNPVGNAFFFTDTGADGARDPSVPGSCSDWTANAPVPVGTGSSTRTTGSWSAYGTGACTQSLRLICLQGGGAGPALPTPLGGGRLAFLSSDNGTGELGSWFSAGGEVGIVAGDEICRTLAQNAGLPHATSFLAWLSDDVGGQAAIDRFGEDGPFVRLDGTRVAANLADLTDPTLLASSIHQTEHGQYFGSVRVWTGTDPDGNSSGSDCFGWTSGAAAQVGDYGAANAVDDFWSSFPAAGACDFGAGRLYCLGDYPDPTIFADGFESGGTSAWSAVVP